MVDLNRLHTQISHVLHRKLYTLNKWPCHHIQQKPTRHSRSVSKCVFILVAYLNLIQRYNQRNNQRNKLPDYMRGNHFLNQVLSVVWDGRFEYVCLCT